MTAMWWGIGLAGLVVIGIMLYFGWALVLAPRIERGIKQVFHDPSER